MYCVNKPPNYIVINGNKYEIITVFFTWAINFPEIVSRFNDNQKNNEKIVCELIDVFIIENCSESYEEIVIALSDFFRGYPKNLNTKKSKDTNTVNILSYKHDMNDLIIAIRNQSGIDLTHRSNAQMHWWDFLLEVENLTDTHKISKIMGYRAYKGKDTQLLKLRREYALPVELSNKEKQELDEFNKMFGGV